MDGDRSRNGMEYKESRSRSRSPIDHPKRDNFRDGKRPQGEPVPKRVYVTNIPYNCRWSDLKDLFRQKVGDVAYVDLFEDENGRFKGNGVVEFNNPDSVQKAIQLLNKTEYKGRLLYIKEDTMGDRGGRFNMRGGGGPMGRGGPMPRGGPPDFGSPIDGPQNLNTPVNFNTYGLSPKFLQYLNITGPLVNKVFVSNLTYRVDEAKLRDVFNLAGKVVRVDLKKDKDGQSKGQALIEFDHPVEAVQAISMFNGQKLFNRIMSIRMDRFGTVGGGLGGPGDLDSSKLPSGLSGIGKGLGTMGQPLQIPKEPGMNTAFPIMGGGGGAMGTGNASMNMMPGAAGVTNPMAGGMGMQNTMGMGMQNTMGMGAAAANPMIGNAGGATGYGAPVTGGMGSAPAMGGAMGGGMGGGMGGMAPAPVPAPPAMGYGNDRYDNRGGGMGNDMYSSPPAGGQSDTILLRNLPLNVTWQMLKDRFRDVGDIRHVDLKGRGMAVMRFGSERDARRAVDLMHGLRVDGRPIEVTLYN